MNILIIGNGFDIAHELPTQYTDFLNLCLIATKVEIMWVNNQPSVTLIGVYEKEDIKYRDNAKDVALYLGHDLWMEFEKTIENNFWIHYFQVRKEMIGEKWIDFEDEIRSAMESLYSDKSNSQDENIRGNQFTNKEIMRYYREHNLKNDVKTYRDLFICLMDELKKMIYALAIYMDGYINQKEVDTISYISKKQVEKVLSFNYTCTYTENYKAEVDCCYIHGKADIKKKNSNLVLGFDNHYLDNEKVIPELIPFEKYYQRIVNGTDNQYFQWLEEMDKSGENNIIIFGHSLGITDGDILRKFILNKNVKTTIVYCSEYDRAEKIKNLAVILRPDKLIEMTGGSNPLITFECYEGQ